MATQLTLDALYLVFNELAVPLAPLDLKDAFNLCLVSGAVHDFLYSWILRVDARIEPFLGSLEPPYWYFDLPKDVECWDNPRASALEFFIKSDNVRLVSKYFAHIPVDMNAVFHLRTGFRKVLSVAVEARATSVVKFLLQEGIDVSGFCRYEHPLRFAVRNSEVLLARMLLEHGSLQACTNPRNRNECISEEEKDYRIFGLVTCFGRDDSNREEINRMLLSYCSDINRTDEDGLTILHRVCANYCHRSSPETIRSLVHAGADIDALTRGEQSHGRLHRRTALNFAAERAEPKIIQVLLEMGASAQGAAALNIARPEIVTRFHKDLHPTKFWKRVNRVSYGPRDNESQVPLVYAAPTPLYGALSTLLNRRPWDHGVSFGLHHEVAKAIQSAKALVHHGLVGPQGILDESRNVLVDITFLSAQIQVDATELWGFLLESGVFDVHHRNEFGQAFLAQLVSRCFGKTPLLEPFWKPSLIRALINAGSDPDTVDHSGMTPLHWSVLYGDLDTAELLVELGANPAKEVNGATPTHYAFGKPFARRGPIVCKAMSLLRKRLTRALIAYPGDSRRLKAFADYRKRKWYPLLSVAQNRPVREKHAAFSKDAERQMFSIMALLSPFAECSRDENGHTPREIAESASTGLLKEGESHLLRLGPLRVFREARYPFPRPLIDLDTNESRHIGFTQLNTTSKMGQFQRFQVTMARFR